MSTHSSKKKLELVKIDEENSEENYGDNKSTKALMISDKI